jgi:hypothetical protein
MADPRKTLDLFKQVELTLAGIYTLFAKKFPSHAEEWKKMAGDELEHAQWIEILEAEMAKGNARFTASKIRDEGFSPFQAPPADFAPPPFQSEGRRLFYKVKSRAGAGRR